MTALSLPDSLRDEAQEAFAALSKEAGSQALLDQRDALLRLFAASPFASLLARTHSDRMLRYLFEPDFRLPITELAQCADAENLARQLRHARNGALMRIAYRDLNGLATLPDTLQDLSALADTAVLSARDWHGVPLATDAPVDTDGTPIPLLVLGMGKLGGTELNFSSDIDLIFTYPDPASDREQAQEYFIRLGQRMIKTLDEVTADGFVFRVDMRLRPFGSTGALALPFSSMESYYQNHGREWERYALLKARVMGPQTPFGEELMELLRPFIYRRFLDFRVMDELREMKSKMEQHALRAQLADDLKHGPGGIREAEFVVQCAQLVFGGQVPELRLTSWHRALEAMIQSRKIQKQDALTLRESYDFLRCVENRLQMMDDQQVHTLPGGDLPRERLRFAMGFEDWDHFMHTLDRHRKHLHEEFTRLLHVPSETPTPSTGMQTLTHRVKDIETDPHEKVDLAGALLELGLEDATQPAQRLFGIVSHALWRMQNRDTQQVSLALIPKIIHHANTQDDPGETVNRLFDLLAVLLHQPSHLSLLNENPGALKLLTRIVSRSSLLLSQLLRTPELLDELLDVKILFAQPTPDIIQQELDRVMQRAADDLELQMSLLRRFRQAQIFRVAVCDVLKSRVISDISDELTWIAEAVTRQVWALSAAEHHQRHGTPQYTLEGDLHEAHGAVLAYGKFGGLELGYQSDLDLVFLHDSCGEQQMTNGDEPVDNEYFFTRITQRFIHIMETLTADGVLYEIDTQLRPGGKFGLAVCSLQYLEKYLREQAWTWEHQALVRARMVIGDKTLQQAFETLRQQVLCGPRKEADLRQEFMQMRQKMHDAHKSERGRFNLKSDPGGIVDLEFLVHYWTLMNATTHPSIIEPTATVMILDQLAKDKLLDAATADFMRQCYFRYRDRLHALTLQGRRPVVSDDEMSEERTRLHKIWATTFPDPP